MDTVVAVTLEELAVARDELEASSGRAAARPRLVLVTGAKAGEGATTLALNLAAAATRAGAKVVLVEADPLLGDLALMLGLPANADAMLTHPSTGIRVLVLPPADDPFELIDARVLTEALATLQTGRARGGPIDLIVLDATGPLVRRTGVAGLADRVLVTCSARLQNVKNARILIDELGVIASEVVLNRTGSPRSGRDQDRGADRRADRGRDPQHPRPRAGPVRHGAGDPRRALRLRPGHRPPRRRDHGPAGLERRASPAATPPLPPLRADRRQRAAPPARRAAGLSPTRSHLTQIRPGSIELGQASGTESICWVSSSMSSGSSIASSAARARPSAAARSVTAPAEAWARASTS